MSGQREPLKNTVSLATISVALSLASSAFAGGLPVGGHFAQGHGAIAKANQSLTVKQSSTTGIINWNSFSVGKRNGVTFDNGSGATLNRVTGGNLSRIAGSLRATGSLYLLNSQGVIVSGTGRVVTGGSFIASSGSLSDNAFDDHERRFGSAAGKVVNRGSIAAGDEAKLVGSGVYNTGAISAAHVKLRATIGEALADGTVTATGNAHHDAHILVISNNGETKIAGTLDAHNRNGSGGEIETSGRKLAIAGHIDAGHGGTWLVDPDDLIVDAAAAATVDSALDAGTNVTLETTANGTSGPGTTSKGAGDIKIESELTWNTKARLTVDALHSIFFDAPILLTKAGGVTIGTNGESTDGDYYFDGGDITFADVASSGAARGSLEINGHAYTLAASLPRLAAVIAKHPKGHFALADSYDASIDGTYASSPVWAVDGTLEGLGNVISNLNIVPPSTNHTVADGLINGSGKHAVIRDIGIIDSSVSGNEEGNVGGLIGSNNGEVLNSYFSGSVSSVAPNAFYVGGLVGFNIGTIKNSYSDGNVYGLSDGQYVGGLVGLNYGTIMESHSAASTSSQIAATGGLVGYTEGPIIDCYATGNVSGGNNYISLGGLIGGIFGGSVQDSFATGNVSGGTYVNAGGLVGNITMSGWVTNSYSTGSVSAQAGSVAGGLVGYSDDPIRNSYATGSVLVGDSTDNLAIAGGLVGLTGADVTNSYSTGSVTSGVNTAAGGLIGYFNGGIASDDYSLGQVTAKSGSYIGGAIGIDGEYGVHGDDTGIEHIYWDTRTSGLANQSQGDGDRANLPGIKGKSTKALRARLPSGFGSSIWAENPSINGGLPYLISLKASY